MANQTAEILLAEIIDIKMHQSEMKHWLPITGGFPESKIWEIPEKASSTTCQPAKNSTDL